MTPDYETLQSPPTSLCACSLGGEYVHIAAISPRSVTLRLPEDQIPCGALVLHLYRAEAGQYEHCTLAEYHAGEAQRQEDAVLLRLFFDDPACARAIRRMMNSYARALEIKSESGASAWAAQLSGYPAEQDDVFHPSLQQQRSAWFSAMPPLPQLPEGISLAVELNCPELWKLYMALPLEEFMQAYARSRELPDGFLPRRLPDRLYIGNSHCRFLFPGEAELRAIARKAEREGLSLTLSTAELRAGGEDAADRLASLARELGAELEINDWGMLRRCAGMAQLLLGTRLNRRRKDPRMKYKPGMDTSLLAENSLSSSPWRSFLRDLGVVRYEYETCGLPTALPEAPCSLHLPFYQTNTALWCPMRALCLNGDRGAQGPASSCARWCEENALLYPAHLNMVGRWNSLLALSQLPPPQDMARYDRWVLNF